MGTDESPIDTSLVPPKNMIVADAVYKPHETALIKWGLKYNLKIAYGIQMLINQGIHSFSIWTGVNPTLEDTENILKIFLEQQKKCIKFVYVKIGFKIYNLYKINFKTK